MNLSQISLLQINYFNAVARHLSFTDAAKSLYISQPAISKQIALLEQQIGVQLFERTKRSVKLTPAGALLAKELSEINDKIERVLEKTRNMNLDEGGVLSLGFLEALDNEIICSEILKQFREKYPKIILSVETHSFNALREKLLNRTFDLIFTLSFEIENTQDIHWETLAETQSCIIMSSAHPLAKKEAISLSDCKNEDFYAISREESPRAFDSIISLCLQNGFTPNIVKHLPNIDSLLLSVESGLGIAIVDAMIRLHREDNFRIVQIENDPIDVGMAWRRDNDNPSIPVFTEMFRHL